MRRIRRIRPNPLRYTPGGLRSARHDRETAFSDTKMSLLVSVPDWCRAALRLVLLPSERARKAGGR